MKIFRVDGPECEKIQIQKKDGSMMVVSLSNLITINDMEAHGDNPSLAEQAAVFFGMEPNDFKKIPVKALRQAVKYALEKTQNPGELTETKQG